MGQGTCDIRRSRGDWNRVNFVWDHVDCSILDTMRTRRFHAMFRKRDSSALCSLTRGFLYDLKCTKGTEAKHRA